MFKDEFCTSEPLGCVILRGASTNPLFLTCRLLFCLYRNGVHYLAIAIEQGEEDALRIDLHAECTYGVLAFCPAVLNKVLVGAQSGNGASARVVGRRRLKIYSSC